MVTFENGETPKWAATETPIICCIDKLPSCVCRDYNEAIVRIPSSINLYDGMSQIVGIQNWQSDLHSLFKQVVF